MDGNLKTFAFQSKLIIVKKDLSCNSSKNLKSNDYEALVILDLLVFHKKIYYRTRRQIMQN